MKTLFILLFFSLSLISIAQAPEQISYQAVARNANGQVIANQAIGIKLDLHQGSVTGTVVFSETHTKTTNLLGLFTLGIGSVNTTAFSTINWENGPYFMEVSIDANGGSSYTSMGTQQLMSVPYALYAKNAGGVNLNAGNGISINSGTITNTAPNQTVNISGSGVSGAYPNYTVSATSSPSTSISSGNTNLSITQSGTDYTLTPVTPTLDVIGGTLAGAYPNQTLTVPSGITYTNGAGISITSGSVITNTSPNQTVNISGSGATTVSGAYPNYTVSSTSSPSTTLVQGNNISLNQSGNTYTVSAPAYSVSLPGGNVVQITNGVSTSTAPISATNLTLSGANNTILSAGGNTIALNTYSAGTGIAISGTAPNFVVTNLAPAISSTITGTGVATVNNAAPNYTVNVPMSIYNNNTGVFTTGTQTIAITPSLSISGTTLQSGPSSNTVSLSGLNGIYGGSGSIQTGSTTVTVGTNTLTFLSGNIINKSIANFFGGGATGTHLAVGHTNAVSSAIKFLGSVSTSPVDYGYISGSANGISISGGNSSNAFYATNIAEVGVGTFTTGIGKFVITHTSSQANPTMHLRETTGGLNRIKFSNNTVADKFFETAAQTNAVDANGAYSINYYDGTTYKPVLLVTGEKKVNINNLNTVLGSLHIMENSTTAGNGIISEGFAQAAQINLTRNNQPGLAARLAVVSGDELGRVNFAGYDGTTFGDGAKIYAKSTENITSSNKGTELIFSAVPTGTNTNKDVFKINGAGNLEVISGLQIPFNATAGRVLTSDAAGNASWQNPSSPILNYVTGSPNNTLTVGTNTVAIPNSGPTGTGTINTLPLWTGANTLGNSVVTQNAGGGIVMSSTASPSAAPRLRVRSDDYALMAEDMSGTHTFAVRSNIGPTNDDGIYLGTIASDLHFMTGNSINPDLMVLKRTTNRLGIGTKIPSSKLHVVGNTRVDSSFIMNGISMPFQSLPGQGKIFFDNTSNRFMVSENGGAYQNLLNPSPWIQGAGVVNLTNITDKVGIGIASPAERLEVAGRVKIVSGQYGLTHTDGTTSVGTYVDGDAGWLGTLSVHPLYFFTDGDAFPEMTIMPGTGAGGSGNVGINNNNPTAKLEVNGTTKLNGATTIGVNGIPMNALIQGSVPFTTPNSFNAPGISPPFNFSVTNVNPGDRVFLSIKPSTQAITNRLYIAMCTVSVAGNIEFYLGSVLSGIVPPGLNITIDYLVIKP